MVNVGKYTVRPMDMGYIPVGCPHFPGFQDSSREGWKVEHTARSKFM